MDVGNWPYQGDEAQTRAIGMALLYLLGCLWTTVERPARWLNDWRFIRDIRLHKRSFK